MQDRRRPALHLLRALRALPVLAPTGAVLPAHGPTATTPAASAPKGTEAIRPAPAAPLQAAEALLQQGKAQGALAKLNEAARKTLAELAAAAAADPLADAVRLWALWAAGALQVLTRAAGARAGPSVLRP